MRDGIGINGVLECDCFDFDFQMTFGEKSVKDLRVG
jgi:predicted HNH restriction endonuclease